MREPSPIDQILRHWDPGWRTTASHFTRAIQLAEIPIVDITNVDSFKRENPGHNLGVCAPPWGTCAPVWKTRLNDGGAAYGMAMLRCPPREAPTDDFVTTGFTLQYEPTGSKHTFVSGWFALFIPADGSVPVNNGLVGVLGHVLGDPRSSRTTLSYPRAVVSAVFGDQAVAVAEGASNNNESWVNSTIADIITIYCAFSFANCKNVVQRERGFTSPPIHWVNDGHPRVRYRVLAIDGRASVRMDGEPEPTGRRLSLHIVRGHFATYTPEKPLFGKHTGNFWVSQHTRGDASVGEIRKDYRIGGGE